MTTKYNIIAIPDTHFPFTDLSALNKIYKYCVKYKPTHIVQLGDLHDFWSFSRFPRNPSLITPKEELEKSLRMARNMWARLRQASPKAICHQLIGNHDERPKKRILSSAPELIEFLDLSYLYEFEKVKVQSSQRDELYIGNILFTHGHLSQLGAHARETLHSVVHGHTHKGGILHISDKLWEADAGFLGDKNHPALSYTMYKRASKWRKGFVHIDEYGPRFVTI